ncbi:MAG TPA: gliding motility protein GldC [Saprospiraceae bacterium]|nr:gliding motility protein GldC [Saprospiraceae bacterium]
MPKSSDIKLTVQLDDQNVPEKILWNAEGKQDVECKAMLLSLFDKNHLDTYKIDLWTKEMHVMEMDRFMYQSLRALAETYFKATHNSELANAFQSFVEYFGENTEVIPKSND